ncbi:SCO family protein [Sulfuriferula plumbiphila]|nr:SCO family protein [Sulfuriferula plumbiphila]
MKTNVRRILYKCLVMILGLLVVSSASARSLGGDFELEDTAGHSVRLSMFHGKVVLLAFGFTHCPDICPTTLLQFAQLSSALGSNSDRVQAIFISVDPARDTPEVLTNYVGAFNRKILPLTGTRAELMKVAKQYGTYFRYVNTGGSLGYSVDHSGNTYVIDAQGKLSAIYPFGTPLEEIERYVEALLQHSR